MASEIIWKENGWTLLRAADAEKHELGISCFAENGTVTAVNIRHNDGEEQKGTALYKGNNALPLSLAEFKKLYLKGDLDIR